MSSWCSWDSSITVGILGKCLSCPRVDREDHAHKHGHAYMALREATAQVSSQTLSPLSECWQVCRYPCSPTWRKREGDIGPLKELTALCKLEAKVSWS